MIWTGFWDTHLPTPFPVSHAFVFFERDFEETEIFFTENGSFLPALSKAARKNMKRNAKKRAAASATHTSKAKVTRPL